MMVLNPNVCNKKPAWNNSVMSVRMYSLFGGLNSKFVLCEEMAPLDVGLPAVRFVMISRRHTTSNGKSLVPARTHVSWSFRDRGRCHYSFINNGIYGDGWVSEGGLKDYVGVPIGCMRIWVTTSYLYQGWAMNPALCINAQPVVSPPPRTSGYYKASPPWWGPTQHKEMFSVLLLWVVNGTEFMLCQMTDASY
jgi:hypothetical protein